MNYNKYEQSLLEAASSLDVLIQSDICFKQNVLDIFSNGDDTSIAKLCINMSAVVNECNTSAKKAIALLKDKLVCYVGYCELCKISSSHKADENDLSLEELLDELGNVIGLSKVKDKVYD